MTTQTPGRVLALSVSLLCAAGCGRDWNALDAENEAGADPAVADDAAAETGATDAQARDASAASPALDAGQPDAGRLDGAADVGAADVGVGDAGPVPPKPCESAADPSAAIFISSSGTDAASCGSAAAPCLTLARGFERAQVEGRTQLVLSAGSFVGGLDLRAGLVLSGGFDSSWKRDCAAPLRTTIQAPAKGGFALRASDLQGTARLDRLTLLGADAASVQPGQSVYGLFVSGESSSVELDRVDVRVPNAGRGTAGSVGAVGAAAAGNCAVGTGASGTPGKDGLPGQGAHAKAGYQAGNGTAGSAGSAGANGTRTLAVAGSSPNFSCTSPCGTGSQVTLPKGGDGLPGCGGLAGQGGAAGTGGGSSVAVFVWDAQLRALGGSFAAGNGGDGGAGGDGGTGSAGSAGKNGAAGTAITVEATCCGTPTNKSAPGGLGMAGGSGGKGGQGGAGSGGDAYAVYVGGLGRANLEGTALSFGKAGEGGGGSVPAASGMAAPKNF